MPSLLPWNFGNRCILLRNMLTKILNHQSLWFSRDGPFFFENANWPICAIFLVRCRSVQESCLKKNNTPSRLNLPLPSHDFSKVYLFFVMNILVCYNFENIYNMVWDKIWTIGPSFNKNSANGKFYDGAGEVKLEQ